MQTIRKSLFFVGLLLMGLLASASSCAKVTVDLDSSYRYTETVRQTINFTGKDKLILENPAGSIELAGWSQTTVELLATKQAKTQEDLEASRIDIEETATDLEIRSGQPRHQNLKWIVDYVLKVPVGADLHIDQGAGDIRISNFEGTTSINLGAGDLKLEDLHSPELSLHLGAGDVNLMGIEAQSIQVDVGAGNLDIRLRPDASFTLTAEVGMGDVTIKGFPAMQLKRQGFIFHTARAVLGRGEGTIKLHVGVGDIDVRPVEPPKP